MEKKCLDEVLPMISPSPPMKLLSWNIRGLNSKGNLMYLKERIQTEKPNIILLQETKVM